MMRQVSCAKEQRIADYAYSVTVPVKEKSILDILSSAENKCLKKTNLHRRGSVSQSELSASNYRFVHAPVVAADAAPSASQVYHDTSSSTIAPVE